MALIFRVSKTLLPSLRPGFPPDSQSAQKLFLPTFSLEKK